MTGQEARDDEREALIETAGSFRQIAGDHDPNSMIGLWLRTASELESAVVELAEARKHPEPEIAADLETWLRVEPYEAFCVRNGISVETTNATEPVEAFLDGYRLAVSRVRELLADARKEGVDDV